MSRTQEQVYGLLQGKDDDDRLTLHAAAQILGVAYPTMQRYRKNGWIRAVQFGSRFEVCIGELRRFAKDGNYTSDSPNSAEQLEAGINRDTNGSISLALCTPEQIKTLSMSKEEWNKLYLNQPIDDKED